MPENIKGIKKGKVFKIDSGCNDVVAHIITEIVGELQDILIQNIMDRKRLVSDSGIGNAALTNFNSGEICTKSFPVITKAVITCKKAIGEFTAATIDFQGK